MQNRPQVPRGEPLEIAEEKSGIKMSGSTMTYIIMAVIAVVAAFAVNYLFGVSKTGVEQFQKDTTAVVESLQSDLKASTSTIKLGLDGIPAAVNTKVDASMSSITSRLSTLETDVKRIDNNITSVTKDVSSKSESAIASVSGLLGQVDAIKLSIKDLQAAVAKADSTTTIAGINTKLSSLETQAATLKKDLTVLQNQYNLIAVTINSAPANFSIATGTTVAIPLSITNSGATTLTVPIKLVLTTANAVTVTSAASLSAATTNISGTTITFTYNVDVGAGYTVIANVPVAVNFTGTSPNTWTAIWSKQ